MIIIAIAKAHNAKAKYPFYMLRMLVQQYSLLTEKEANQVLYGCFVNLHEGHFDRHIAADIRMEYSVKAQKKHIQHMQNHKDQKTISMKTSATPGLAAIAENFDNDTDAAEK